MKQYCIPSLTSLDSSKLHLFKNQATCPSLTLGLEDTGVQINECGIAFDNDRTTLCLSEAVDPSLLVGLLLDIDVQPDQTIISCTLDGADDGCPAQYECFVTPGFESIGCVNNIRCADGTLIASCSIQNACNINT
jgi:hypothetical protein